MFSINIKRSAATLGVVAGLLAAAVPASAMRAFTTPPRIDPFCQGGSRTKAWSPQSWRARKTTPRSAGAAPAGGPRASSGIYWKRPKQARRSAARA